MQLVVVSRIFTDFLFLWNDQISLAYRFRQEAKICEI